MKLINKLKSFKLEKSSLKKINIKDIHISKIKLKKRYVFLGIALLLIIGIIAKLFLFKSLPTVANYTVLKQGDIVNSVNSSGIIESNNISNIHSEVNSTIEKVNVKEGDKVKKGDVLAVLKTDQLENDIKKAEEEIKNDKATNQLTVASKKRDYVNKQYLCNNKLDKDIKAAQIALDAKGTTLEEAQKNYECNTELYSYGEISDVELKKSKTDYEAALREYDQAVIDLENAQILSENSLKSAEEDYKIAQINQRDKTKEIDLQEKKRQLQECVIKATESGTVTKVNAVEGGESGGILFVIKNLDDVYVDVPIKAVDILNIKSGQDVIVKTDTKEGDEGVKGKIESVTDTTIEDINTVTSSTEKATSSNNNNFKARVKLDKINENIKVGIKATVEIIIEKSNKGFEVPYECINEDDTGKYVLAAQLISKDKYIVKRIPVKTGMETDLSVQIISPELKANDIILNDSINPEGTEIKIIPNDLGGEQNE